MEEQTRGPRPPALPSSRPSPSRASEIRETRWGRLEARTGRETGSPGVYLLANPILARHDEIGETLALKLLREPLRSGSRLLSTARRSDVAGETGTPNDAHGHIRQTGNGARSGGGRGRGEGEGRDDGATLPATHEAQEPLRSHLHASSSWCRWGQFPEMHHGRVTRLQASRGPD